MKRFAKTFLTLLLLLSLFWSYSLVARAEEERVLRMDYSGNMSFPSMYTSKSNGPGFVSVTFCFDTLVWKDDKGEVNLLCEDYELSDDGLVYTIHLRDGVKFHDGEPFTAEDVKFTFDYSKEHPYQWISTDMVKEVRVVDDLTVEIELKDVYVPFMDAVGGNLHMLPKHIFEKVEDPYTFDDPEAAIGTGPFILEDFDPVAGSFVFVKNPDYYLGEVQIDKLILAPVDDARSALLAGEIDATSKMKYKAAQAIKDEENISYLEGQSIQIRRMGFNFDLEALAQKDIRQAISYALDREAIVEKAAQGAGIVGTAGFVHPNSPWYNPDVAVYDYNPEKAKELLAEAGCVDSDADGILEFDGEKMSFEFTFSEDDAMMAEMISGYLKDIGIELVPKALDDGSVKGAFSEGNFELILLGHGTFGGDPKYMACLATDTAGAIKVSIQGGTKWQNDRFDELFAESLKEIDKDKRLEQIYQCQEIVAEELPTLAVFFPLAAAAYNNSVFTGFYFTVDGIGAGCPFICNKLAFISGEWVKD